MAKVTLADYEALVEDRPVKFTPEEVGYQPAPQGSAIRCANCFHYWRRSIDGMAVCEIMRSPEVDEYGVRPDWRCRFQTVDGDSHPLLEPEPQ
jgi:hypothetical protein